MRLTLGPMFGKWKVKDDCSVKFCPSSTKSIQDKKPDIQEDILNPGYLRIPAGTVFHLKRVHLSAYHNDFSLSCPTKHNDRKNPWSGLDSYFTQQSFEDFNIDVEKVP